MYVRGGLWEVENIALFVGTEELILELQESIPMVSF